MANRPSSTWQEWQLERTTPDSDAPHAWSESIAEAFKVRRTNLHNECATHASWTPHLPYTAADPHLPYMAWDHPTFLIRQVRSHRYLTNRLKQPSAPAGFTLCSVSILPSTEPLVHVAERLRLPPRAPNAPLVLIVSVHVPGACLLLLASRHVHRTRPPHSTIQFIILCRRPEPAPRDGLSFN